MSVGQLTDHECRVILDFDFCYVYDCHTGRLFGTGPRRHDSLHLWEIYWLRLPSIVPSSRVGSILASSAASSFAQWHHRLGHLCVSHISTLVHHGIFGLRAYCLTLITLTIASSTINLSILNTMKP